MFTVNPIETTKKKRGRPRKNPHVLPPAQPVDDRRNDLFIADLAETSVAECVQVDDGHGGTQSIMLPSYFSDAFLTTEVVATSSATTTATSTIAIPSRMYGTPQSDSSAYAYRPLTSDNMLNASPALPCAHKPPSAATVIGGGQHTHPPSRGMIEDSLPTLIVDALGRDMLFTMSDGTHDGAAHDHRTHDHGPNSGGDADATILADFANRIPWADFPLQ